MTTETILTIDQIDDAQEATFNKLQSEGYNGGMGGFQWDRASARAIEQAVLQSPEIQRALQDKVRLDWIEAQGGADITRLSGGDWECDAGCGYGFVEMDRGMRAAIDAAMEQKP